MAYPHRPTGKKPKSSEHLHGKRKTWLSDCSVTDGKMDLTPRQKAGVSWWKSPLMKAARMKKAKS